MTRLLRFLTTAALCAASAFHGGAALAQWKWVNPLPTGAPISALDWDGSRFVGFDFSGAVLTSSDGFGWTSVPSGSTEIVHSIAFGNGVYVAAGSGFSGGAIEISGDGLTWTQLEVGVPVNDFSRVIWNPALAQFVLVGSGGVILTSANGSDWFPQGSGTVNDLNDVAWSDGRYVVVGANGTLLTSTNGSDWIDHSLAGSDLPLISVASNGSLWAIVQANSVSNEHSIVLTNPDATKPADWQAVFGVIDPSTRSKLTRVLWDGAAFVALGGISAVSPDGTAWTVVATGAIDILEPAAFSGDTLVATDFSGDVLVAPLDAQSWFAASSNIIAENLTGVIWTGTQFAAASEGGAFLTSDDGINWNVITGALPISARALAFHDGTFVVVGQDGAAHSSDGFNFDAATNTDLGGVEFRGVAWGGDTFVAVGAIIVGTPPRASQLGVIYTSLDGATWTKQESNALVGDSIHGVIWAGDHFVAVGASSGHAADGDLVLGPPTVFTSADGTDWTRTTLEGAAIGGTSLNSVAWNGQRFVAVGSPGFNFDARNIATSVDGVNWQYIFPLPDFSGITGGALDSVTWTGSRFVAVGGAGSELTSPDGLTWTAHDTGAEELLSVAASGTQCIAVGNFGEIMREETACDADKVFRSGFE